MEEVSDHILHAAQGAYSVSKLHEENISTPRNWPQVFHNRSTFAIGWNAPLH